MTKSRSTSNLLIFSGVSQFGTALTLLACLTVVAKAEAQLVWVPVFLSYAAIACAGPLTAYLSSIAKPEQLLRIIEIIRAALLLTLALTDSLLVMFAVLFVVHLIEGIFHPIRYAFIAERFPNPHERTDVITRLQSVDATGAILGPMLAGLVLLRLSPQACFIIDAFSYAGSAIFWTKTSLVNRHNAMSATESLARSKAQGISTWRGYQLILSEPGLTKMTLARMIGNVPLLCWSLWLPVWLSTQIGSQFSLAQGSILSASAVGLLLMNALIRRRARAHDSSLQASSQWPLRVGPWMLLGLLVIPLARDFWPLLCAAGFSVGMTTAAFRTGGILTGQAITPPQSLASVVSAGDSIVRTTTAAISAGLGLWIPSLASNSSQGHWPLFLALPLIFWAAHLYQQAMLEFNKAND